MGMEASVNKHKTSKKHHDPLCPPHQVKAHLVQMGDTRFY
jgi:hypothetical protein